MHKLYLEFTYLKIPAHLILSSHLRLGLPGLFPIGLPVTILKALLPSSILDTCPAHLNLLDLHTPTILGERYKLWSSSLWSLPHYPSNSTRKRNPHQRASRLFKSPSVLKYAVLIVKTLILEVVGVIILYNKYIKLMYKKCMRYQYYRTIYSSHGN